MENTVDTNELNTEPVQELEPLQEQESVQLVMEVQETEQQPVQEAEQVPEREPEPEQLQEHEKVQEPEQVEVQLEVEEPLQNEEPVKAEAEKHVKAQVEVEEHVQNEEPVKAEAEEHVKAEVEVEEHVQNEELVKAEEHVQNEEPVKAEAEEHVQNEEPVKAEEPLQNEEPVKTEEPVQNEELVKAEAEKPVPVEVEEPVQNEELVKVEVEEPVQNEELVKVEVEEHVPDPEVAQEQEHVEEQVVAQEPEKNNITFQIEEPAAIPKIVFIVPYRDREKHQAFFASHMKKILEDMEPTEYKIYYTHQCDNRDFNRGAMKNIGFIIVKQLYPNDYKNITIVFNDVDTMPFTKNSLNYVTKTGIVKHFYGFKFALGGIVSITGEDFEKVNGYPNLWTWGYEDNLLQKRVLESKIAIDHSQFYPIMDKNILQLKDGFDRLVNRGEFDRYINNTVEGINSINNIQYTIDETTGFINITQFNTGIEPNVAANKTHDIRNGAAPFGKPPAPVGRRRAAMGMIM